MTTIPLADDFAPLVLSGHKRTTVRRGNREVPTGPAVIATTSAQIPVTVTGRTLCTAGALTEADARADGFDTLADLWSALHRFYPELAAGDLVTIIAFEPA